MPAKSKPVRSTLAFNHAMIYVGNVERSLEFYEGRLGLKVIERFPGYARLRAPRGSNTIALHEAGGAFTPQPRGGIRLYFETRDLRRFCQALAGAGVQLKQMPKVMPWGWKHAYLDDPDGYEVSLYWAGHKRLRQSKA
jgi:catechol 2,3-dioxygenase-like lactoylglutathione lyase family enzyme